MLVLSLFPGIGLLDMAFEEEGFCVVRGPDLLWGGDIRRFHPPAGTFDGVIGGPPCQAFSTLCRLNDAIRRNGRNVKVAENLIPEFERATGEAEPDWFLMENVPDAPMPIIPGLIVKDVIVRDVWVGGETSRLRRFSFGTREGIALEMEWLALHRPDPFPAVTAASGGRSPRYHGGGKLKRRYQGGEIYKRLPIPEALRRQGLAMDFLSEAPFTVAGKQRVIGNGVPLPMGRAIARAVKRALQVREATPGAPGTAIRGPRDEEGA